MLRQQLTLVIALGVAMPLPAGQGNAIEQAAAQAEGYRREARETVDQATVGMHDPAVTREAAKAARVTPAPPGALALPASGAGMDIEAILERNRFPAPDSALGGGEPLLIFISASVPRESLRRLARQAALVGAPLVLRGIVGDDFPDTSEFLRDILGDEEPRPRAMIHPALFTRFDVEAVPSVVLAPGGACVAGIHDCPSVTPVHVQVAGDVTLDYALDYIARTHPEARPVAEALSARLGGAP